jgi:RNA polymerase sigma-70 factor (ECF subfamily)
VETDLNLAAACMAGDERAIETVRTQLAQETRLAASKTTASRDQVDEVVARLSRVLFVDEPHRPAALRGYTGRGELKSYLRVMAIRELVKVVNRGRREVAIDHDDFMDRIVPPTDPEISILRRRYRDDVDGAMRAALQGLDERERALLRYACVDNMNVDEVGKLYNVHRATAARWIAAARDALGKRIRDELAARLRIDVGEVDSIVRLVQSRIDVSLDRVLGAR